METLEDFKTLLLRDISQSMLSWPPLLNSLPKTQSVIIDNHETNANRSIIGHPPHTQRKPSREHNPREQSVHLPNNRTVVFASSHHILSINEVPAVNYLKIFK